MDSEIKEEFIIVREQLLATNTNLVRLSHLPETLKDHEIRLRNLEAYVNKSKGAALMLSFAGGAVAGIISILVQLFLRNYP